VREIDKSLLDQVFVERHNPRHIGFYLARIWSDLYGPMTVSSHYVFAAQLRYFARSSTFNLADCTYQPLEGPRRLCTK
jgi:hypothetical protein